MTGTAPEGAALRGDVLERIVVRFAPVPPNGIDLPAGADVVQLRIGTLAAETSWPEISELVGVANAKGDLSAITVAFPAIQAAVRERHGLTRRLMVRVWAEAGLGERLMERFRPGGLRDSRREWLVWGDRGDRGGRWREEP